MNSHGVGIVNDPSDHADPSALPIPSTNPHAFRQVNSRDILGGEREVWIVHGQDVYRLRETKNGKLILQK